MRPPRPEVVIAWLKVKGEIRADKIGPTQLFTAMEKKGFSAFSFSSFSVSGHSVVSQALPAASEAFSAALAAFRAISKALPVAPEALSATAEASEALFEVLPLW